MIHGKLLAVSLLLAGVILLALRVARPEARAGRAELSAAPWDQPEPADADSATTTVARESARGAVLAPVDAPAGLRIRSAEGLALSFVEIEGAAGAWHRRELVQQTLPLGITDLPCRIRAPGHAPGTAKDLGDEIVLEADSLLEIVAPGLRSCLRWWNTFAWLGADLEPFSTAWHDAFWMRATQGFTSEDRWAIAVNGEGMNDTVDRPRELTIVFKDRTHRMLNIRFDAAPGARASWSPICSPEIDALALQVEIQRPPEEPHAGLEWTLRMHREVDEPMTWTRHAWGRVELRPDLAFGAHGKLPAEETHLHVDRVPRGEEAELTLHDPISGAHGQIRFVHDGTPLRVTLRPGFSLHGKIAVPPGNALPKLAGLRFGARREPSIEPVGWPDACASGFSNIPRGEEFEGIATSRPAVPITPAGAFEVRGQDSGPWTAWIKVPAPEVLLLEVEVQGFELHRSTWPLGDATRVDCGELVLVPSAARIELAPGHGLKARLIHTVHTGGNVDPTWRVSRGRDEPDGAMTIVFARGGVEHMSLGGAEAEVVDAVVVACSGALTRAFLRGTDGRFDRVDEADYEVEIVFGRTGLRNERGHAVWTWRGISNGLTALDSGVAEPQALRFRAPRDGVTLSWSIDRQQDDRRVGSGSVPLHATSMTITLP